jgi:hypothetical protein
MIGDEGNREVAVPDETESEADRARPATAVSPSSARTWHKARYAPTAALRYR